LRPGELAGLKKTDIDWERHRLTVYGKGGPCGSMSRRRVLPVSVRVRVLMAHYFANHDALRLSRRTIQRIVGTVAKRASISRPVSTHTLRHDFAVTAMRKGISLPRLQRLLGHDQLTTPQLYLNLSPEDVIGEHESKRWEAAQRGRSAMNTKHDLKTPPTA
jgi:integrase/recombinase XerD